MSEAKPKSKRWPKVASVRKNDDGSSYIKLEEGVELILNGEKVPLNEKRVLRLECPRKNVEQLRDRGIISEQQAGERLEKLAEMTWLKYEVVASPPKPK